MALDGCIPTDLVNQIPATSPEDAWLFEAYLHQFCYACDVGICP